MRRRALLWTSLATNIGLLGYFKYGGFILDNFVRIASGLGFDYHPATWGIVLPVGISFYTFQTLSYTIDVYRGDLEKSDSFLDFALYVTFFPQLVSGPIVRAKEFLPQLAAPVRALRYELTWGLTLFTIGLFEKIVLADSFLAPVVDRVYGSVSRIGTIDAWIGVFAFAGQIFFDFAGYSTCAIGVAMCFGFALPDNFRFPYAARGFVDFWRRWHISLSSWWRDYLYIPFGGSRRSHSRVVANLMFTMLIAGLWHGAAWRFVWWGGLHGVFLVTELGLRRRFVDVVWTHTKWAHLAFVGITFGLFSVTLTFFRASTFGDAVTVLGALLGRQVDNFGTGYGPTSAVLLITTAMLLGHHLLRETTLEDTWAARPSWVRGLALGAMITAIFLSPATNRAFIYFQF